jgi:hypothetical protein
LNDLSGDSIVNRKFLNVKMNASLQRISNLLSTTSKLGIIIIVICVKVTQREMEENSKGNRTIPFYMSTVI